ncbi:MAG: hypothetical protein LBF26_01305 [Puniceicoccales bacterium]|jgi:hypothetical protein|nr:hypothetical protein [Puniceicoccales bacterium]
MSAGTDGISGGPSPGPLFVGAGSSDDIPTVRILVANPDNPVTDEDVLELETLLNEHFGTNIDLPEAHQFANQEEFVAFVAGMLTAIDEIAVNMEFVHKENGDVVTEFVITGANMQNDQLDSVRTTTASQHTTTNIMMEVARIMAEIMATQADTQAMFGLSSLDSIMNAFQSGLNAAQKKKEAAQSKLEADKAMALSKIVEGAFQAGGGLVGMLPFAGAGGLGQVFGGAGRIAGGILESGAAGDNFRATMLNIEAEEFQQIAQLQQSMGNRQEQSRNDAKQVHDNVNRVLGEMASLMNQTIINQSSNIAR